MAKKRLALGTASWRMAKPCADCPFSDSAAGTRLRQSLHPGRMAEIKHSLRNDSHFICHKTTRATGDGSNRVCAGALAWQEERGLSSNYARVAERLAAIFGRKE